MINIPHPKIIAGDLVALSKDIECNPNREKSGGVLTLLTGGESERWESHEIGTCPTDRLDKYHRITARVLHVGIV
jgi:hypothetical protein